MSSASRRRPVPLRAAVADEVAAVQRLSTALQDVRECSERRDVTALEEALAKARNAADRLARAGAERLRCTVESARTAGLSDASTLVEVADLGDNELREDARGLLGTLQELARASAALGITARFGADSCGRLQELQRAAFGLHAGYGANGRLGGLLQSPGRQA